MTSEKSVRVLAISGSLRKTSLNTALINAAITHAPDNMTINVYEDLKSIPPYDDDDISTSGFPDEVENLRNLINESDALIFSTPEYNRSFSGILKNAIDWVSRPPQPPLYGKPALVTGVCPGPLGTALANHQLRQVLSILNVRVLPGMELLVGNAAEKFDECGVLVDEITQASLIKHLISLRDMAK